MQPFSRLPVQRSNVLLLGQRWSKERNNTQRIAHCCIERPETTSTCPSSSCISPATARQQQQKSEMACPAAAMRFSRSAAQCVCFSVSSVLSRRMRTCSSSHASSTPAAVPAAAAADANSSSSSSRPLVLLGIESSCDDTGAAVLTSDGKVLGEALATQAELHAPWGGVVPSIAQAAHKEAIDRVVDAALSQAGISAADLDAVAVTVGPGLSLCLDVGVRKAREVSRQHGLPLVPVHHMEAHALVARLAARGSQQLPFPFLCLLVSGGHNLLVLVKGVGHYMQLGTTLDDALGEAYDKVARMLGLDLRPNGGAALEAIARQGDPQAYPFNVPMKKYGNCDFSYAGLKTSVRLCIERELGSADGVGKRATNANVASSNSSGSSSSGSNRDAAGQPSQQLEQQRGDPQQPPPEQQQQQQEQQQQIKANVAASFQRVAVAHLVMRLKRAIEWAREEEPSCQHLVVAGGVASNQYVRQQVTQVAEAAGLQLVFPPPRWCTDNGVMVAWAGMERYQLGLVQPPAGPLPEDGSPEWIELRPRWPLTGAKHPKSMPPTLSMKKPHKQAPSLTDLTQQELQQQQQAAAAGSG